MLAHTNDTNKSIGTIFKSDQPIQSPQCLPVPTGIDASREKTHPAKHHEEEQELILLFEQLAQIDHQRALSLASEESDVRLCALLIRAALRGWASVAPAEAAQFAITLPIDKRRDAIHAVFQGSSVNPQTAAEIALKICRQEKDTTLATDYGRAFVDALSDIGAFSVSVDFAISGGPAQKDDWLNVAFFHWAKRQPADARRAFGALTSSPANNAAFQGLVLGWSVADPATLANYAATLPAGNERSLAIGQALTQWISQDPAAASRWLGQFEPSEELDVGTANLAAMPALAKQNPAIAVEWAQSIVEPTLRASTLSTIAYRWAENNPRERSSFLNIIGDISPMDQQAVVQGLDSAPRSRPPL